MSAKSTIALLVAFAALVGAYFLYDVTDRIRNERFEKAKKLFEFEPGDVQHLVIEQDGARPVAGTRGDKTWTIERPEGVPANPLVWDRVATALSELKQERLVNDEADDVSEYELDPPLLSVDATLADGRTIHVAAGAKDPFQTHRYARVDDGAVILITEDAFFELNRSLLWLRDRDLVTAGESGVRRIEFLRYAQADTGDVKRGSPSKVVAAERAEADGRWMLTEPVEGVADQAMVNALVEEVRFAKGRGYIDNPENLDDYGLDVPGAGLTVYTFEGEPRTIYYGNVARSGGDENEVYVRQEGRDAVFLVSGHVVSLFPKSPDAFLEKRILSHPGSELAAIELAWGDTDVRMELDANQHWRIVTPIEDAADPIAVSQFISALVNIVGAGFFSDSNDVFGFNDPPLSVTLELKEAEAPLTVRVGLQRPTDGRYYVEQASGGVTTVAKEDIDALMLDLFHFREKRLFDFRPDAVGAVAMRFRGEDYAFEIRNGLWAVRQPDGYIWETQSDMEVLLTAIADARYEAIETDVAPDDLAPYGLDESTLEFRATITQPAVREVGPLRIGDPAEDNSQQRYATVEGRPEVFRVPQAIVDGIEEARRGLVEK